MTAVFSTTLQQMLGFFALMLVGFLLAKRKILPQGADRVMSKLETTVFLPALTFTTFAKNCTVENLKQKGVFFAFGIGFLALASVLAVFLAKLFVPKKEYLRGIYRYSFIIANYGYMGNALVLGLFGDEALFDYMMFTQPFSIFIYTYGVLMLDPGTGGKGVRWKSLFNPSLIGLLCGMIVGLLPFSFPSSLPDAMAFLPAALDAAKGCMSPVAMLLTGFVVGSFPVRQLLGEKKVYFAALLRLIALPAFFMLVLKGVLHVIPIGEENAAVLSRSLLCCMCMPMGLNTVVFPASFGADTRPGAGMALISNVMGLATIPLMFLLFGISV